LDRYNRGADFVSTAIGFELATKPPDNPTGPAGETPAKETGKATKGHVPEKTKTQLNRNTRQKLP
jgi:hypothetical protein